MGAGESKPDLTKSFKCHHCATECAIPENAYEWFCRAPGCAHAGLRNNQKNTNCELCALRRDYNDKYMNQARCSVCSTVNTLPPLKIGQPLIPPTSAAPPGGHLTAAVPVTTPAPVMAQAVPARLPASAQDAWGTTPFAALAGGPDGYTLQQPPHQHQQQQQQQQQYPYQQQQQYPYQQQQPQYSPHQQQQQQYTPQQQQYSAQQQYPSQQQRQQQQQYAQPQASYQPPHIPVVAAASKLNLAGDLQKLPPEELRRLQKEQEELINREGTLWNPAPYTSSPSPTVYAPAPATYLPAPTPMPAYALPYNPAPSPANYAASTSPHRPSYATAQPAPAQTPTVYATPVSVAPGQQYPMYALPVPAAASTPAHEYKSASSVAAAPTAMPQSEDDEKHSFNGTLQTMGREELERLQRLQQEENRLQELHRERALANMMPAPTALENMMPAPTRVAVAVPTEKQPVLMQSASASVLAVPSSSPDPVFTTPASVPLSTPVPVPLPVPVPVPVLATPSPSSDPVPISPAEVMASSPILTSEIELLTQSAVDPYEAALERVAAASAASVPFEATHSSSSSSSSSSSTDSFVHISSASEPSVNSAEEDYGELELAEPEVPGASQPCDAPKSLFEAIDAKAYASLVAPDASFDSGADIPAVAESQEDAATETGKTESDGIAKVGEIDSLQDVEVPDIYAAELDQLAKLGFTDQALNRTLLELKKGQLLPVLNFLTK